MANSVLKILVTNPNMTTATTTRDFMPTDKKVALKRIINYLNGICVGCDHGSGSTVQVSELGGQTQATATVTCTGSVSNNSTVTLGNIVFTAKTSGAVGNQFNIGTATVTGANLAAAINANTNLNPYMTASNNAGTVTITGINEGEAGDLFALTSSDGTNLAVVGFASGVDVTVTTYNF